MSHEESPQSPPVLASASPVVPKTVILESQSNNIRSPSPNRGEESDDFVEGTPEREAAEARKRVKRSGAPPRSQPPEPKRNLIRDLNMAQDQRPAAVTPTAPGRFAKLLSTPKPVAHFTAEQLFSALSQELLVTLRNGADQTYGEMFPLRSHNALVDTLYEIVCKLEQLHRSQENQASPLAQKILALLTNVTAFINANAQERNSTTVKRNAKYFYFTLRYSPELSQHLIGVLEFASRIYSAPLHHLNPLREFLNTLQREIMAGIALLNSTPGKQQNVLYHLLEKRLLILQTFHDHLNRIETERQAFVGLSHRPLVEEINGLLTALEYVGFDFRLDMNLEEFASNVDTLRSKLRVEKEGFRRKLAAANNDHTHTIPLNKAIEHLDALDKKLTELQMRVAGNQKTFFNTVQKIGNAYLRAIEENSTVLQDTIDAISARDEILYVNAQPAPEFIMPEPPEYIPNEQDVAVMAAIDLNAENAEAEYRAHFVDEFSHSQMLAHEENTFAQEEAEEMLAHEETELQAMVFSDDEDEIGQSQLVQMAGAHDEEEAQREAEQALREEAERARKRHRADDQELPTQPTRSPMLYGARNAREQFRLLINNVDEQIVNAMETLTLGGELNEPELRRFAEIRVNDLSALLFEETVEANPELQAKIEAYRNRLNSSIVNVPGKITLETLDAFAKASVAPAITVRLK